MSNFILPGFNQKYKKKALASIQSTRIAVFPLSRGAGASFVCSLLASFLPEKGCTALVECCSSYFYEALGFEKRFVSRNFSEFGDKLRKAESLKDFSNTEENISWWLRMPGDNVPFSEAELFRLLYAPKEEYIIFDCSGMGDDVLLSFLAETDIIIGVADPLPTALLSSVNRLARLKAALPAAYILVNKMNRGVRIHELSGFLGLKDYMELPFFSSASVYKSQYACRLPADFFSTEEKQKTKDMLMRIFH